MPHLLMNLRHVPDDEADEIRALFETHAVNYYETPPSRWLISMGGFWTHDADEARRARSLLKDYQQSRFELQRTRYERERETGELVSFRQRLLRRPVTVLAMLLAIVVILGFALVPYLLW